MINMTTLFWKYKIYNFRWKEKMDVHIIIDLGRRQISRCEEQI